MNYINDITKENVHLFMQPIADNFDHVNEHTLDWILYVNKNNLKPVIPIITKNFITIAKRLSRHILLKARNNCPTSQEVVETTSVCLACFVWLAAITYAARYAARKFGFIQ